ncbi:Zinc finger C2H2-type/integrase DNA-binding domain [Phytophthora cactorum]|nr:Zinc finger C2H2-type/integrase DNA-binding domain [Phytophthora cactorum]
MRQGFLVCTSLRTHLDNVYPCNESMPAMSPREGRFESKTCFKCGKTFASWQGLRGHLNRIKPCDQEKPAPATTTRRRPAASRTCTKCGKTFSSPQSLRIHMNRVKPCDQDTPAPTTPPATASPSTPLMMNTEDLKKEAERKAKARYQARKAYLKKRGRLDELGDPPSPYNQASHYPRGVEEAAPKPDLKRHASDEPSHEGDNLESSNTEVKKQRVQEEQSQDDELANSPSDVSTLTTEPNMPAPPIPEPQRKRWARKLMNRMQQLEDEVVLLRQKKYGGESATTTDGASTNTPIAQVVSDPPTQDQSAVLNNSLLEKKSDVVASHSQAKPANIFRSLASSTDMAITSQRPEDGSVGRNFSSISARIDRPSSCKEARREDFSRADGQQQCPTASGLQGLGSDKRSLMDAYTHMNDQILMNERVVEESNGHAQFLVGCNPDFRRQVDELRVSISTEKSKREITVAALIAREWKPGAMSSRRYLKTHQPKIHTMMNKPSTQNGPRSQAKCPRKTKLSQSWRSEWTLLESPVKATVPDTQRWASFPAKWQLSTLLKWRLRAIVGVYVGLVKASTRIRSLVKNALL